MKDGRVVIQCCPNPDKPFLNGGRLNPSSPQSNCVDPLCGCPCKNDRSKFVTTKDKDAVEAFFSSFPLDQQNIKLPLELDCTRPDDGPEFCERGLSGSTSRNCAPATNVIPAKPFCPSQCTSDANCANNKKCNLDNGQCESKKPEICPDEFDPQCCKLGTSSNTVGNKCLTEPYLKKGYTCTEGKCENTPRCPVGAQCGKTCCSPNETCVEGTCKPTPPTNCNPEETPCDKGVCCKSGQVCREGRCSDTPCTTEYNPHCCTNSKGEKRQFDNLCLATQAGFRDCQKDICSNDISISCLKGQAFCGKVDGGIPTKCPEGTKQICTQYDRTQIAMCATSDGRTFNPCKPSPTPTPDQTISCLKGIGSCNDLPGSVKVKCPEGTITICSDNGATCGVFKDNTIEPFNPCETKCDSDSRMCNGKCLNNAYCCTDADCLNKNLPLDNPNGPYCNPLNNKCGECLENSHCKDGKVCETSHCVCPQGAKLIDGKCSNPDQTISCLKGVGSCADLPGSVKVKCPEGTLTICSDNGATCGVLKDNTIEPFNPCEEKPTPICGNGIKDEGEVCDRNGNQNPGCEYNSTPLCSKDCKKCCPMWESVAPPPGCTVIESYNEEGCPVGKIKCEYPACQNQADCHEGEVCTEHKCVPAENKLICENGVPKCSNGKDAKCPEFLGSPLPLTPTCTGEIFNCCVKLGDSLFCPPKPICPFCPQ